MVRCSVIQHERVKSNRFSFPSASKTDVLGVPNMSFFDVLDVPTTGMQTGSDPVLERGPNRYTNPNLNLVSDVNRYWAQLGLGYHVRVPEVWSLSGTAS